MVNIATSFPTTLQDLDATRGSASQRLNSPSHVTHHTTEDDTIEALQTKVGVDSSAVTTSLDYILKNTTSGHDHDGTDSKKVVTTNLDVTGLTASELLRVNSGGTAIESAGLAVASIVTLTGTQTLTNKTLTSPTISSPTITTPSMTSPSISSGDVRLPTGGNIQVNSADPKRGIYIPSFAMFPATTNGCAATAQVESTTNKINYKVLDFDQSTEEYAFYVMPSPSFWDLGTVTAEFHWTAAAGSGDVIWGIAGVSLGNDDAIDTALGTAQTVTDTLIATGDVHLTADTAAVTIAGTPAKDDFLFFRIYRDADAAGDTIAGDVRLIGVTIRFGIAQYDDQ